MRRGATIALTLVGGLLLGALAGAFFVGRHWQRNFADWYVLEVADQANVAREIYSGREERLADGILASLPSYVRSLRGDLAKGEGSAWALWIVSDVYKAAGTPPPAELQEIFEVLPERQSCKRPAGRTDA